MRMFWSYLKRLAGTGWGLTWLIAGAASTTATFALIYFPGLILPRWISIVVSIVAWVIAPFRLFQEQEIEIEVLKGSHQAPRRSELKLIEEKGSIFIRRSAPDSAIPRREVGIYLRLAVSIENKGQRSSTICSYGLRIDGVCNFQTIDLSPQNWVWGLKAQHSLNGVPQVSSYLEVPPERLTANQNIPFVIDSVVPGGIKELRCELTIRDTEGNSASGFFTAVENG